LVAAVNSKAPRVSRLIWPDAGRAEEKIHEFDGAGHVFISGGRHTMPSEVQKCHRQGIVLLSGGECDKMFSNSYEPKGGSNWSLAGWGRRGSGVGRYRDLESVAAPYEFSGTEII